MAATLSDCKRFLDAVTAAQGTVPDPLSALIHGAALLNAPTGHTDPAVAIVKAAQDGTLTESSLTELVTQAATAQTVATYRADLRQRSERMFVSAFASALQDGADTILDSLRPRFDAAAQEIAHTRSVIPAEGSAEAFMHSATPEALRAWQELPTHLSVVSSIAGIAVAFGPRNGHFPLITEYSLGDGFKLDDRAIIATGGNIEAASALFRRPDQGHRTSPWFRLPLHLHTVASAQERYDEWAAAEWEKVHSSPPESWIDQEGHLHEKPRPVNPYKQKVTA